ncbi:eIF-2-alpha kinase GCN2-like [Oppia nitens]|uniref:eIF-2-alpha kinase GCN2-like n=1 Tax=Oppia nitens TaxID=1686743 RepID=UPI0023DAD609|nr:eIF-2-alpha kinase GCN2-like [Oppia nitens]
MATNYETIERQKDELSALKAIFGSDLKDLRQSVKHMNGGDIGDDKWSPIEVMITLKPMVSMSELNHEPYVQTDLYVKCGKRYPNVIPEDICLKNVKRLPLSVCQQIKDELYVLAKSLKGEVMIFAFTDHVRQSLHTHNKPPIQSFYDQMISHKTKLEYEKNLEVEKQLETNRRKDEMKRKQLEEEMKRRHLAFLQESRLRRESREDIGQTLFNCVTSCDIRCDINHEFVCLTFDVNGFERQIQRGKCLFHNNFKHSVEYLAIDMKNGQTFVISEWVLNVDSYRNNSFDEYQPNDSTTIDDIVDRITKVETFFNTKLKSLNHKNLIRYLGMTYTVRDGSVVIDLLQEHINANSLHSLANVMKGHPFNLSLINYYSKEILEILDFLSKHNCPHGDLKPTNIFIDSITGEIKISGYYLEKQFYDIFCDLNSIDVRTGNSNSISTNINRLKMKDIYDFGLIVFAISNDWNFVNDINGQELMQRLKQMKSNDNLRNFLDKCLDIEEPARWPPEKLLNHSFISYKKPLMATIDNRNDIVVQQIVSINDKPEQSDDIKNDRNIESNILFNSIVSSSVFSRLNEFEVLDELGKGGFGQVFKVKNILDGRCYALKKIHINSSNNSLYEKIKREVNLLSRLNHENVVRYFTSWIETEDHLDTDDSEISSTTKTSDLNQISTKNNSKIDKKSKSTESKDKADSNDTSNDSSDTSTEEVDFEAEEDIFGTSFFIEIPQKMNTNSSDSQYVVFERSNSQQTSEEEVTEADNKQSTEDLVLRKPICRQYMYIQMELCEKSTLRDAIDGGLYNEGHRKRRLFREIIEGLVHIHEQGVIHRDLKPGNIFLDVNDHVKIGDFGLAKEIYFITGKDEKSTNTNTGSQMNPLPEADQFKLTGKIGTPFYVAPELTDNLNINSNKIYYTQKVDIYSLGVIFFEMSYPFQTLMERTKVVINLRNKNIILPLDVNEHFTGNEIEILKNLLQHDYTIRPSSAELLALDYLPAPEMEEKEEQNVIRRAVQNTRTKINKYMLNMLFQKDMSEIEDYVFDINDQQFGTIFSFKSDLYSFCTKQRVFQYVYSQLEYIMQSHCGVYVSLPTLLPKYSTQIYQTNDTLTDVFYAIDNNGSVISLLHNLRVPFARYIARNKISHLRRYSIEKVYRQRRPKGYHPKELWECVFDIVTPKPTDIHNSHIMPDSEVLSVLNHVINQFPMLSTTKLTLRVNHIKLIKAILEYCDIEEEMHKKIIGLMGECNSKLNQNLAKESNDPLIQKKSILEKCIEETKINNFLQLINLEQDSVKKLLANIKTQMRKKSSKQQNALQMAKSALKELDLILKCAERLGSLSKMTIKLSPSFVMTGSSSVLYSGIIFQLEREIKRKKSTQRSVLAVGGRYDDLVTTFDNINKNNDKIYEPKGCVGLSIELEKIMKCVLEEETKEKTIFGQLIDVVVCSLTNENTDSVLKELCFVTKEFWNSGVKVFCFPEDLPKNIDDLHAFCLDNSVRYAVALKEAYDSSQSNFYQIMAKLFAYEKERYIDKKGGNVCDIVEYVIRSIASVKTELNTVYSNTSLESTPITRSDSNKLINSQLMYSNEVNYSQSSSIGSNIKVSFITGEKLQSIIRKRQENTIISHLSSALSFVTNNIIIEVIAVDLPFKVIKTICAEIELDEENEVKDTKTTFEKSKLSIIEKHLRHRKHITQIIDTIFDLKIEKKCPLLCIISTIDNMKYKILS